MPLELVRRYSAPVPRYTSYPTAPHFNPSIGPEQYRAWLEELRPGSKLSLYFHIPFCQELCWYCGCTTKAVARYEPVRNYLEILLRELRTVGEALPVSHEVTSIHWGGGSPNILSSEDIQRLDEETRRVFHTSPRAEFAVEIDPRKLTEAQVVAFRNAGVNRVSVGVQDFSPEVQTAINRVQSFAETERAFNLFRAAGVTSINVDLVYGLPHQTRRSVAETIQKVLMLAPDRIAIFGYAHLPSRFKHQRLIKDESLPDSVERFGQSRRLARVLTAAGYTQIGIDHFAKHSDSLAQQDLKRNFQGYTTDAADALLGIGLSAIGQLPQGYVQNAPNMHDYTERVTAQGLATVRGFALSAEDRMRAYVIERLMCDFTFSGIDLKQKFGPNASSIIEEARSMIETDEDGLIEATPVGFELTERGKPFVRSICACFDTYLGAFETKHAPGV